MSVDTNVGQQGNANAVDTPITGLSKATESTLNLSTPKNKADTSPPSSGQPDKKRVKGKVGLVGRILSKFGSSAKWPRPRKTRSNLPPML